MTTAALEQTSAPDAAAIERVLIAGDLSKLTEGQRVAYYNRVCQSLGLNPLTRPFSYIILNNKLTLYALRDAAEQLRKLHRVSITALDKTMLDGGLYVVTATAADKTGRTDASTGAVSISGLRGENLANALMKAETKAKRRVTLSICGLGMLDETEVESIGEHPATVTAPPPKLTTGEPARVLDQGDTIDTASGEVVGPFYPVPAGAVRITKVVPAEGKRYAGTITVEPHEGSPFGITVWESSALGLASELCAAEEFAVIKVKTSKQGFKPSLQEMKRHAPEPTRSQESTGADIADEDIPF